MTRSNSIAEKVKVGDIVYLRMEVKQVIGNFAMCDWTDEKGKIIEDNGSITNLVGFYLI